MKSSKWKSYLLWILLAEFTGVLSGLLSQTGTQTFQESTVQPPFSPPAILFPIVWSILYALMGFGAARIALTSSGNTRNHALNLFIIQLIVNFFWSLIFFNAQAYSFAFIWLVLLFVLVIWMSYTFHKIDSFAAYLQIPYILWLVYAAYLSFGVWILNK